MENVTWIQLHYNILIVRLRWHKQIYNIIIQFENNSQSKIMDVYNLIIII